MIKYVLHPGWIYEGTTWETHRAVEFVTAAQLAERYSVPMSECYIPPFDEVKLPEDPIDFPDAIHLYPDYTGQYKLPE